MIYDQNSPFGYLHETGHSFAPIGEGVGISQLKCLSCRSKPKRFDCGCEE